MQTGNTLDTGERLITVIMPCYNAVPFVREAVTSVMDQSHSETELVIVDDGSTDGSIELLKQLADEYPDRITLLFQDHEGPYIARNHALRHARGAMIAFLDADDWWRADLLEKLGTALEDSDDAILAYCGWQNVGLQGARGEPYVPPEYDEQDKAEKFLRAASPWPIHAALVRRQTVDKVGGFQTYLPTCMDYDFWLRIGLSGPVVLVPEVMAFYRHQREGQIISRQWLQAKNVWTVKKTFVRQHPELVAGLEHDKLRLLIDGGLLRRGYDNYWRRDLVSARHIFRQVLRTGGWQSKDLRYLLPALLPEKLYVALIGLAERNKAQQD